MRQKLNTGHYGPAPTVNVIPELDGNRVKKKQLNERELTILTNWVVYLGPGDSIVSICFISNCIVLSAFQYSIGMIEPFF